jgi:hypothetical protein
VSSCAECGRDIVRDHRNGLWAEVQGNVRTFICAEEIRDDRLIWGRWHYIEGEQQQVWPPTQEEA